MAITIDGGAVEGASRANRETFLWEPSRRPPDAIISPIKERADARGRDMARNEGVIHGAVALHRDNIVGSQFRLIYQPDMEYLGYMNAGFNADWMETAQEVIEARFRLIADSNRCWLDAQSVNTFTGMIRLATGIFTLSGEYLGTAEYNQADQLRPIRTNVQVVSPDRLCNPQEISDTETLRRGIERLPNGTPVAYNFRMGDKYAPWIDVGRLQWKRVPSQLSWGRKQVIHIFESESPDQSRGMADIVAALKEIRMFKQFKEITLQSAVVNATYAAAIESDLPPATIANALGDSGGDVSKAIYAAYKAHMSGLGEWMSDANNVRIDGTMIPQLFPNTKLNMMPVKTAGGVGTDFEAALLRHLCAPLGLSYEALSRDFSKTNYSSARAALGVQRQFMDSRKKHVADRLGSEIFTLVLEEMIADGEVPMPRGVGRDFFYADRGIAKEALCKCDWIGSGAGQIDEVKETEAAMSRIRAGLSSHRIECARLGYDVRQVWSALEREQKDAKQRGLIFDLSTRGNNVAADQAAVAEQTGQPAPAPAGAPANSQPGAIDLVAAAARSFAETMRPPPSKPRKIVTSRDKAGNLTATIVEEMA